MMLSKVSAFLWALRNNNNARKTFHFMKLQALKLLNYGVDPRSICFFKNIVLVDVIVFKCSCKYRLLRVMCFCSHVVAAIHCSKVTDFTLEQHFQ